MALNQRLDLRQGQSLVMTPQLQQAIKLLALSNLEIETFIGEAVEANPLLEIGETAPPDALPDQADALRRTHLESSPVDQLVAEGRVADQTAANRAGARALRARETPSVRASAPALRVTKYASGGRTAANDAALPA